MKTILCLLVSHMLTLVSCQPSALPGQSQVEPNQTSPSPSQRRREWRNATFLGLTIGKSTRADMLRLLGKPVGSSPYDEGKDGSGLLYEYKVTGEIPGAIVIAVDNRTNLVLNLNLEPQGGWSKEQAIKHFGPDYIVTRYGFDDCLGDGESAPLYETPDGPITKIEYRERGIAIAVNDQNNVDYIMYVSEPVGATSSRCKNKGQSP